MDLSVMADEVIGPLLCNPENQRGWPKIVASDMKRHVNELRNLMHQVSINIIHSYHPFFYLVTKNHNIYFQLKGEMSSQVMLPMPAGVETIYQAESRLKER